MKLNLRAIFIICLVFIVFQEAEAADKLRFYISKLAPLGLRVKTILDEDFLKTVVDAPATSEPATLDELLAIPQSVETGAPGRYYAVTTASLFSGNLALSTNLIMGADRVVVVCDQEWSYADTKCGPVGFESRSMKYVQIGKAVSKSIGYTEWNGRMLVFIPEDLFISISSYERVKEFFNAVSFADNADISSSTEVSTELTILEQVNRLTKSKTFRLAYLVLALMFAAVFLREFYIFGKKAILLTKSERYTKTFYKLRHLYISTNWVFLFISVAFVIAYYVLSVFVFHKANVTDLKLIAGNFVKNIYPGKIIELIKLHKNESLILVLVSYCFFFSIAVYIIPSAVRLMSDIALRIRGSAVRGQAYLPTFFTLLALVFFVHLFVPFGYKSLGELTLLVLIIFLLLLPESFIDHRINIKHKLVFVVAIVGILAAGFLFNNKKEPQQVKDILRDQNKIVMLPLQINFSTNTVFSSVLISSSSKLWLNNYLIFHPDYPFTQNKSVTAFTPQKSYIILNDSVDAVFSGLSSNFAVIKELEDTKASPYTFVADYDISTNPEYKFDVDVDCSAEVPNQEFRFDLYYAGQSKRIEGYAFPGCGGEVLLPKFVSVSSSEHFTLETSLDIYHRGFVVLRVSSPKSQVTNLSLYLGNKKVSNNFAYDANPRVIKSVAGGGDAVTNYAFSAISDQTFSNGSIFDLGAIANIIAKSGQLGGKLRLWTDAADHSVIVNKFLKTDF